MSDNITKTAIWDIIEKSLGRQGYTSEMVSKVRVDLESLIKVQTVGTLLEKLPEEKRKELQSKLLKLKTDTEKQSVLQGFIRSAYPETTLDECLKESSVAVLSKYVNHLIKKYKDVNQKRELLTQLASASS